MATVQSVTFSPQTFIVSCRTTAKMPTLSLAPSATTQQEMALCCSSIHPCQILRVPPSMAAPPLQTMTLSTMLTMHHQQQQAQHQADLQLEQSQEALQHLSAAKLEAVVSMLADNTSLGHPPTIEHMLGGGRTDVSRSS